VTTAPLTPTAYEPRSTREASARAFWALCQRDGWVMFTHELAGFLAQSLLQPIFFLLVFGRVLPEIGAAQGSYGAALLPGVVALTTVITGLQNVAFTLVIEFAYTKEIEDRLLAPLPPWLVAAQKIAFGGFRGLLAGLLVLPLAAVILPGGVDFGHTSFPALAACLVVGPLVGSSLGLMMGTLVPVNRINVVFAVVITPLLFTGSTFYPWESLDTIRWFQVVTLVNPLTYVSESMRGALTAAPHLGTGWLVLGIAVALVAQIAIGVRGFVNRAVD
jgi:ABC-2 type transport system permease protein